MAKALRLTAEQRDDLVAYLDGELEEAQTQYLDQVLARSEVARHEVEALARTWELLDLLPKPNATDGFTDRTLTTLRVSEMATPLSEQAWFSYVRQGAVAAVWVLVLSVCAMVGYMITTQAVPNPQARMLAELPLIRNLDVYLEIEDLDYIRELQRAKLFTRMSPAEPDPPAETSGRMLAKTPTATDRAGLMSRYNTIAAASQADRDRIQRNWSLFLNMTPERQAHFRNLHQQLTEQPESLRTTLQTYATWLPTLSPGDRDDLRRAGTSAERLALVRQFKDEQDANREIQVFDLKLDLQRWRQFVPPPPYLSPAELTAMMDLLERRLPAAERTRIDGQVKLPAERFVKVLQVALNPVTGRAIVDPQTTRELVNLIADEALRQQLQEAQPDQQRRDLNRLVINSLFKLLADRQGEFFPSASQLEEVFVSQSGEERLRLMQKSPGDLTRELMFKYWEQHPSEDARRLAKVRSELFSFWRMQSGPFGSRSGFRGDRKDDRGRDSRSERGDGNLGRSPRSPDATPDGPPRQPN
jgi:hypothetical protein